MKTIKENAEELVHLNMIMRADCPIKIPNPKAHDWLVDFLTKFAEQQVKNLNIPAVMQQSELLFAFIEWWLNEDTSGEELPSRKSAERFLANNSA